MTGTSMTRRKFVDIGIALLLAAPASMANAMPGADAGFCAELNRAIEAIDLGDVTALQRSRARPPSFGFGHGCSAQGRGWFCQQALAPEALSLERLAASISQCHPDVVRLPAAPGFALFQHGNVRLRIEEAGARGAQVGRIVTLSIEPLP